MIDKISKKNQILFFGMLGNEVPESMQDFIFVFTVDVDVSDEEHIRGRLSKFLCFYQSTIFLKKNNGLIELDIMYGIIM